MWYVLAAAGILVLVILLLLFSKITVHLSYRDGVLRVTAGILFFRYRYASDTPPKSAKKKKSKKQRKQRRHIPLEQPENLNSKAQEFPGAHKTSDKESEKTDQIEGWITRLKEYYSVFRDTASVAHRVLSALRYKLEVSGLRLDVRYGTGDAASTGFAYGAVWAALSQLYLLLNEYLIFDFPDLHLTPNFQQKCFFMEGEGIIRFRAAHIIKAGVLGVMVYLRRQTRKKSEPEGKGTQEEQII